MIAAILACGNVYIMYLYTHYAKCVHYVSGVQCLHLSCLWRNFDLHTNTQCHMLWLTCNCPGRMKENGVIIKWCSFVFLFQISFSMDRVSTIFMYYSDFLTLISCSFFLFQIFCFFILRWVKLHLHISLVFSPLTSFVFLFQISFSMDPVSTTFMYYYDVSH